MNKNPQISLIGNVEIYRVEYEYKNESCSAIVKVMDGLITDAEIIGPETEEEKMAVEKILTDEHIMMILGFRNRR